MSSLKDVMPAVNNKMKIPNTFVNSHLKALIKKTLVESRLGNVTKTVLKMMNPRSFKVLKPRHFCYFLAVKPVLVNVNFLSTTKAKHITTALIPSLMEVRVLNGNPFYGARRKRTPMGTWLMGDGESVIWRRVNLKTKVVLQFVSFTLLILDTFSSENNQKLDFL